MLEFAGLALMLGVKHSFDADHLVAVSNVLSKTRSLGHAAGMSVSWAAGHMLTATLVSGALWAFRDSWLPLLMGRMDLLVALMLIGLGLWSLAKSRVLHAHPHQHEGRRHNHWHMHLEKQPQGHEHRHMFGIGVVHGLASNDELLVLLTASLGLSSAADLLLGVWLFSLGVVAGMVAFGLLFTLPLVQLHGNRFAQAVNVAAGGVSLAYGAWMLAGG